MKKILVLGLALCCLAVASPLSAAAFEPYGNYTYTDTAELKNEPQAYVLDRVLDSKALGTTPLSNPSDVFEAADGRLYVADAGNNRVLVLDREFGLLRVIEGFDNAGTPDGFNAPQGVFVNADNVLFVADTENDRIVALEETGALARVYPKPVIPTEQDFNYKPIRVCADSSGRLFIVSRNMNKGMIELDKEGNFISFFGAVTVEKNFIDLVWRRLLTQEQLDRSSVMVPTEYSACAIDGEGFVYGTVSATGRQTSGEIFIRRLNPSGIDVLKRNGAFPPRGDVTTTLNSKGIPITSRLTDISVGDHGMYSVLDALRGRVFTYDQDGDLLHVFGSLGNTRGAMLQPRALEWLTDGRVLVADGQLGALLLYRPTEYASLIHTAAVAQYERRYEDAQDAWQQVLNYSSFSQLAYVGMGKALYRQGAYEDSLYYFKLGGDRELYSKAADKNNGAVLDRWFLPAVYVVLLLGAAYAVWRIVRFRRLRRGARPPKGG